MGNKVIWYSSFFHCAVNCTKRLLPCYRNSLRIVWALECDHPYERSRKRNARTTEFSQDSITNCSLSIIRLLCDLTNLQSRFHCSILCSISLLQASTSLPPVLAMTLACQMQPFMVMLGLPGFSHEVLRLSQSLCLVHGV